MANGWGGARAGSGRKRRPRLPAISAAEARIAAEAQKLVDTLLGLALGKRAKDGTFSRPPDRMACEYLINRVMGRPTERRELAGQDGEPLQIEVVYVGLDGLAEGRDGE